MVHPEFLDQAADELLEQLWYRRENGAHEAGSAAEGFAGADARSTIERLAAGGFLRGAGTAVELTPLGEARARTVVRRHRLTERLLHDVLDQPLDETEHAACLLEHVLSPAITDAVCAFLGHPPTCPHGLPIPPGSCCEARRNGVTAVVAPLDGLEPGVRARIVFMTPGFQKRLSRLESFGVIPGTEVVLRQKQPSFVVEIGGTTLALEREMAREIYVRRTE